MIDLKLLEQLADLLNRSDATTIEIVKRPWSTSVKISKEVHPGPVTYQVSQAPAAAPPSATAGGAPSAEVAQGATEETTGGAAAPSEKAANLVEIESPMVGTFYAQPEPGADPYVTVGARVKPGQTLCIIEAMKIMNPLDAEIAGVIAEVCVDDAQPVEFGQVLFRVDPNG
jgi:acetyl-CoA carboxylase biotin carboxyl carrier protein